MPPGTFYKPKFFDFMLEEYYACRESVGIIDMSSFSKMKIQVFELLFIHTLIVTTVIKKVISIMHYHIININTVKLPFNEAK